MVSNVSSSPPSSNIPNCNFNATSPTTITPSASSYMIEPNIPSTTPPLGYFANGSTDPRQALSNKGFSGYSTASSHPYSCSSSGYPYPLSNGNISSKYLSEMVGIASDHTLVNCYEDTAFPPSAYGRPTSYHPHHSSDYSALTSNVMCQSCKFSSSPH